MSIRPIDLQLLLKQMSSVAKKELQESKKRDNEKISKNKALQDKQENIIIEVNKTEADNTVNEKLESSPQIPSNEKQAPIDDKPPEEPPPKPSFKSKKEPYKGNFLDITE